MKQLLSSSRGMTMIEVLLALVISTIAAGLIYTLFITGLNLYQKIQIEGELRDEADYIATMVLNELYSNAPDRVADLPDKDGITLHRPGKKEVEEYIIEDSDEDEANIKIYYDNGHFVIETDRSGADPEILELGSEAGTFLDELDGKKTEIALIPSNSCTQDQTAGTSSCKHGTLSLTMILEHSSSYKGSLIHTEPLVLESSFGF